MECSFSFISGSTVQEKIIKRRKMCRAEQVPPCISEEMEEGRQSVSAAAHLAWIAALLDGGSPPPRLL